MYKKTWTDEMIKNGMSKTIPRTSVAISNIVGCSANTVKRFLTQPKNKAVEQIIIETGAHTQVVGWVLR
jgi:hypothetical protein